MKGVEDTALKLDAQYKEQTELEGKIDKARADGNTAAVTAYTDMLKLLNDDIKTNETFYTEQNEKLRKQAQETSSELAKQTTNILVQLATTGNWFGKIMESMGLAVSLEGTGKTNLLVEKSQENIKDAE